MRRLMVNLVFLINLLRKVMSSSSPGPIILAEIKVNTCNIIAEGKRDKAVRGNSLTNAKNRE